MGHVIMRMGRCHLKMLGSRRRHHIDRFRLHNREHEELEKFNVYKENDNQTLYDQAKALLEKHKEVTGRKARSDAVVMIDFVFTVSPEMREELLRQKQKWINAQLEWIRKNFPHNKICAISYEEDESSPHLHAYIAATEEKGNLNARSIIGNASKMSEYQNNYENFMIDSNLFSDIEKRKKQKERKKGEKVHNVPIRKFKQQQQEELEQLKEEIEKLKAEKKDLAGAVLSDEPKRQSNKKMHEADFLDL